MRVVPDGLAGTAGTPSIAPASRPWPLSYALLAAFAGAAAVTAVAVLAGGTHHPAAGLVAYGVLAVLVAVRTRPAAVPGIAVIAWLFDDGFLLGRHGVLTWHGSADVWRLLILAALAAAASAFGSHVRAAHRNADTAGLPGAHLVLIADGHHRQAQDGRSAAGNGSAVGPRSPGMQ
jgi:hypothetical protein